MARDCGTTLNRAFFTPTCCNVGCDGLRSLAFAALQGFIRGMSAQKNVMIVICHRMGFLGNQLFLFAHMIAAAEESGTTVLFPGFTSYAHFFSGPSQGIVPRYPAAAGSRAWPRGAKELFYLVGLNALRLAKRGGLPGIPWFDTKWDGSKLVDIGQAPFQDLISKRLVLCGGFFYRSPHLLKKHAPTIRAYFAPSPEMATSALEIEKRIRSAGERIVGVHIRRGDYRIFNSGNQFYELDVYAAYMRRVRDLLDGQCRFIVCSDESLDPSAFAGFDFAFGPGDIMGDLLALSACDLIIGVRSTFSGWASFSREVPRFFMQSADPAQIDRLQLTDFSIEWDGW